MRSGTLHDPCTATVIDFVAGRETSTAVQIDHVVALSDARQKGAQQISPEDRLALANDPLNLLAVDGPTNQSKGDGDAATWLPPNRSYWCPYVSRQVEVKAKYHLWVPRLLPETRPRQGRRGLRVVPGARLPTPPSGAVRRPTTAGNANGTGHGCRGLRRQGSPRAVQRQRSRRACLSRARSPPGPTRRLPVNFARPSGGIPT